MFNRDFAKDLSLNATEEYKFDHNKIQAKLDNNLQEVIHLDYGNVGSQVMGESIGDTAKNRDSKLIDHIGKFENGGREGWDNAICPIVGTATNIAVTTATAATGAAAPASPWWGRIAGIGAAWACSEIKALFSEEEDLEDLFDDDHEFEDDPGADEEGEGLDPEPSDPEVDPDGEPWPDEEDPGKDPEEDSENESDDSDNDSNEDPENDQDNDGQNPNSTQESNNPMDDGQGGDNGEADSSWGDVNGDINWGPDGQNNEGDSARIEFMDQLDPITNWGPDGKPGDTDTGLDFGIGAGDPHTNWGDEKPGQYYFVSNLLEILGDINPKHNESDDINSNFVQSMAAVGGDFF